MTSPLRGEEECNKNGILGRILGLKLGQQEEGRGSGIPKLEKLFITLIQMAPISCGNLWLHWKSISISHSLE